MRSALAFLTTLGGARAPDRRALAWFPVVGLGIGLLTGAAWWAADRMWPPFPAAVVAVAVDLACTGLLHLDGLADTADGLLVHGAGRERRLALMRAPDVGAFGVGVVVVLLAARIAALASLAADPLLLAGLWATSRSLAAGVPAVVPYAREEGLATPFLDGAGWGVPLAGVALGTAVAAVAAGAPGAAAAAGVVVGGALVVTAARRRIGGFTGDVLGAAILAGEGLGLLVAAADW